MLRRRSRIAETREPGVAGGDLELRASAFGQLQAGRAIADAHRFQAERLRIVDDVGEVRERRRVGLILERVAIRLGRTRGVLQAEPPEVF